MKSLNQSIEKNLATIFIAACSFGLFGMAFELKMSNLMSGPHIPAIILSLVGGIMLIIGINVPKSIRKFITGSLLVLSLFGIGGVFGHLASPKRFFTPKATLMEYPMPLRSSEKPAPLVPLVFSGMMILGSIALTAKKAHKTGDNNEK